jgi:hypothetical protein
MEPWTAMRGAAVPEETNIRRSIGSDRRRSAAGLLLNPKPQTLLQYPNPKPKNLMRQSNKGKFDKQAIAMRYHTFLDRLFPVLFLISKEPVRLCQQVV